ncbi:hypothetical protein TNCV_341481 [Trichonephila clavipes]|nr:hypothetical protein TNCV_341481 [Trichonephila clavipes]
MPKARSKVSRKRKFYEMLRRNAFTVHDFWPQCSREGTTSRKLWFNQARVTTDSENRSTHRMAGERSASTAEIRVPQN